jgi:hypothetical protein
MRSNHLLAIPLLLPFLTTMTAANADQTYSRWERSVRLAQQRMPNAQAYYGPPVVEPYQVRDSRFCTYQGGPKTGAWACSWPVYWLPTF